MSQSNGYVLITGATSGIGNELAKLFAKDEFNLILVSRDETELQQTASSLQSAHNSVLTIAKDLSKREEVFALCDEIDAKGINIDILVNDAGQGQYGLFKDTDINRELYMIDLNIASVIILTKHFLKSMVERNQGRILFLASIASTTPGPWQSVYHATKAFVLSFAEAVRYESKDSGVTITALMPGATDTDFFNKAEMTDSKIVQDKDSMSDSADVAKDGYEALFAGKDKVVSGFKNKVMVAMGNVMPDIMQAKNIAEQQKPVDQ